MTALKLIAGPADDALDQLRELARRYAGGRLRVAVAWARDEGAARFLNAVNGRIDDVEMLIGINDRGTTVEALLRLLDAGCRLRVYYKHQHQTFHPKLYWFRQTSGNPGRNAVIVGSSNLTRGGLITNYEISFLAELEGDEASDPLLRSLRGIWEELTASRYAHEVTNPAIVEELYAAGYVPTESRLRRERRRRSSRTENPALLPTAPPPRISLPDVPAVRVPFSLDRERPESDDSDPRGQMPLRGRLFVRTLTRNDVRKLHGRQVGTFEPDLGQMARDRFPAFWGWPDRYQRVVRRKARREWEARGRLFSSRTRDGGMSVDITLWFREERPRHAAEHRMRIGPIGEVRSVVPRDFDTDSLVVVQRAGRGVDYDFIIRLFTQNDPEYAEYQTYLTETRPNHRFGYGPDSTEVS